MSILGIARPEIRELVPYDATPHNIGDTRLNANEAPASPYTLTQTDSGNRYPELRPRSLQSALADLFNVDRLNLCPTRGSSEGIDLLVRTFCRAYRDNVVILPPTFEMYAAFARMQSAAVRCAPLLVDRDFAVDWQMLDDQCDENTRIVFLCSPNNPTGQLIPREEILRFANSRAGKTVVVIDEAYIEFSGVPSLADEIGTFENLVILRTLSKAYALAGARCGAVLASESIIDVVSALMSPYAISTPATNFVLSALQPDNRAAAKLQIDGIIRERDRLMDRLGKLEVIERIWPGFGNFVFARFAQPEIAGCALAAHQVIIRQFGDDVLLRNCARITVGTPDENDLLIEALSAGGGRR